MTQYVTAFEAHIIARAAISGTTYVELPVQTEAGTWVAPFCGVCGNMCAAA